MKDQDRNKEELIAELATLRERIAQLEDSEIERSRGKELLKEKNTFLKNILDSSSSISILSTDLESNVLFWNKGAENIFGYKSQEIVGKQRIEVLYPDEETKTIIHEISRFVLEKGKGRSCEIQEITKEGRRLWIRLTLTPRIGSNGQIVGILGIGEDITERVRAEEALRHSQEQLYQAQKMEALGTLVAGVAHEINNPTNLIVLNLSVLQKVWDDFFPILKEHSEKEPEKTYGGLTYDFLKEHLGQLLSDMSMAANRVAKIVADLKNFAKQSKVTDRIAVQLNTAVENALRLAQTTLTKSSFCCELDLASSLPLLMGNLQSIEQIVLNLIINAAQSIHHDQGVIKIATGFDAKSGQINLSVSDNGRGVAPSISDRIFDPFVTDKQAEGGTGLGLSVTYSLVRAHGGEITFCSNEGKGTTFTVFFPVTLKGNGTKILIVDDDESIRHMLKDAFTSNRPYLVEEAANGIEACIRLGTYRPDLVILDILMPEMDGLEVCRNIKREPDLAKTKVVITTGYPGHAKIKEISRLGFKRIHYKPFDLENLLRDVDNMLIEKSDLT